MEAAMKRWTMSLWWVVALALLPAAVAAQQAGQQTLRMDESASVVLRFQIIEADGFTENDPAIADVRSALRELFRFRGYRLHGEAMIRAKSGAEFHQITTTTDGARYTISGSVSAVMIGRQNGGNVALRISLTPGATRRDSRGEVIEMAGMPIIGTEVTVPLGQTVVIGTAHTEPQKPALILVVRPVAG
jgi:hypothetical protein